MSAELKLAVVTSSRADWNSTGMVVKALRANPTFDVSVLAVVSSGDALNALSAAMAEDGIGWGPAFGSIVHSLGLTRDDPVNLAVAYGDAARFAGEALWRLKPDWVFLPGDRWEIASASASAALAGIPIAHLAGGDVTAGSMDDKFRDAITAIASMHFVTNSKAEERLILERVRGQVYNVGSPSIDRIKATTLLSELEMASATGTICDPRPLIVVNWQPETMEAKPNEGLVAILAALPVDATVVFIDQNDDAGSMETRRMIKRWSTTPAQSFAPRVYLSLLSHCDLLIGNSSSGVYEAPAFGTPVINVGNRQKGRPQWSSIYNCRADAREIKEWIGRMLEIGRFEAGSVIYGDGHASEKIVDVFRHIARGYGKAAAASVG